MIQILGKCLLVILIVAFTNGDPLIQLPTGWIRGRESVTIEGTNFYAFEKIPYALPPVGELRFKAPLPAQPWDGILDTTHIDIRCHELSFTNKSESEDCLFINVFTPQLPSDSESVSLPVMMFFYGGGFESGSSIHSDPDRFLNQNVIMVTFNYRVGAFGFLSTQDEVIPGNNGLKDQQLAMQWTHDNIKLFGGDPDKVTIFGQSAGAGSIGYHLLNPKSKGLFRAAILQSGTSLSPWTYQRKAREISFSIASVLNSTFATSNDSVALLEFLRTVPAETLDIVTQVYRYLHEIDPELIEISQGCFWAPVIEAENPDAFITKKMYKLLKDGNVVDVPVIIGMTSEESLMFFPLPLELEVFLPVYDVRLDWVPSWDMGSENRTEIGRAIRDIYTDGAPWAQDLSAGVRFFTDNGWTRPTRKFAELWSKYANTYFYQFSHVGELGRHNTHYDGAGDVAHSAELPYLFCSGNGCDISGYPESDQITSKRLIKIWTDFAKFLNPTPEPSELIQNITWPLVSTENGDFLYVDIGENLEVKNHPKGNAYKQWIQLYDNLGHDDFDTY